MYYVMCVCPCVYALRERFGKANLLASSYTILPCDPTLSKVVIHPVSTVEPPNKRHIGTSHFVLYREVVLSLEVKNALAQQESGHLGP